MNTEDLATALRASKALAPHVPYLLAIARPVIHLRHRTDPAGRAQSKLGGWPDLPPDWEWPQHEHGPHTFVAQIRFEAEHARFGLPDRGLLLLFAATEPPEAMFWRDRGYVFAHWFPEVDGLQKTRPPGSAPDTSIAVDLEPGLQLPLAIEQRTDWPVADPSDTTLLSAVHDELVSALPGHFDTTDHLFGYPGVSSLAYDPTPAPDWRALFCLQSHDALDWCWHDGDLLHVFVEREPLTRRDFSALRSDAG